jgi:hypothetical protein
MKVNKKVLKKIGAGVALAAMSVSAFAAGSGIDISAATTQATSDVNAAGVLIIGVVVACAAFSWVRRVIR